jgi:hypothetical protein
MLGDNPLEEFATALQEGNRPVSLGGGIIRFKGLGKGDHCGMTPRVDRMGEASLKHIYEVLWCHHECPFDEFVVQATGAWGRGAGGFREGRPDLVSHDWGESAGRELCRIIMEGDIEGKGGAGEEAVGQGCIHI